MPTLRVFDPALCCSSGVCGVEVDQALVTFASDIAWLSTHGHAVTRMNLAQEPLAFAHEATIAALLAARGEAALPALLLDDRLALSGRYPSRGELADWFGVAYTAPAPAPASRRLQVLTPGEPS